MKMDRSPVITCSILDCFSGVMKVIMKVTQETNGERLIQDSHFVLLHPLLFSDD